MESARRSEALREEMELHLAEKAAELRSRRYDARSAPGLKRAGDLATSD